MAGQDVPTVQNVLLASAKGQGEEMKTCRKCHIEKPKSEFYKHVRHPDGLRSECKQCSKAVNNKYREANKEKIAQMKASYRELNREALKEKSRDKYQERKENEPEKLRKWGRDSARRYRQRHPERAREATRKWVEENPEKVKESARKTRLKYRERNHEYNQAYRKENRDILIEKSRKKYRADPEKYIQRSKEWAENNGDAISKMRKLYCKNNRGKIAKYRRSYCKNRRKSDPLFKLMTNLRTTINRAITRESKTGRSIELLGCSIKELKRHLESQFRPGMTWDNWSLRGWHIDHRDPISSFDLSDPEQQRACFHYSNLQPLWALENLEKHAKIRQTKEEILAEMAF